MATDTPVEDIVTALPECGVARFLTLLEGPWATLIVRELLHGPQRFTELRAALPRISPHTLTRRLRQFENYGIVTRTSYPEIPPHVEYRLTELGEGLRTVLDAMGTWAMSIPEPAQPDDTSWYCDNGGRLKPTKD
ncbi:helix-turn-helix domain-containing protein [Glycomyces luteolus]|uniref:Helix-turn-helix domain-containing protein n=2 Tax=Glycomyces TaxID=58113 RepID=A0A9X3PEF4_9ACTN|nr:MULTISPECIES: helix-turn-helix domain-containing protein [Glycomyces]MDA1362506.1 helix-turn-helix domain-containing protein [Glycomyces luteolus]MDN3239157.1 helix-turn-helix domain-containing protein [Glycomyces tritici]